MNATEETTAAAMRGRFLVAKSLQEYLLAGRAIVTVKSKKTGHRITLKVSRRPGDGGKPVAESPVFFRALIAPDNERDFTYMGTLLPDNSWRSVSAIDAATYKEKIEATKWLAAGLAMDGLRQVLAQAEVWHEGRCGRCGRRLTVPESISTGFGPECASKMP